MPRLTLALLLVSSTTLAAQPASRLQPDPPVHCRDCDDWNRQVEPFKLFGNTYFVGVAGLSAILITSDDGLILIDGGLTQTAPIIDANIRKLGFRTEDIRLIVVSHEHYDHAAGLAALQRASGAAVATSERAARALASGKPLPEDPQATSDSFPPIKNVKTVADGETLRVGPLAITAHHTPGHTPGAMTWSWQSCSDGTCLSFVYADSLNPVSDDGYRYSDHPAFVAEFRKAIDKVAGLPCDVLLAPHPFAFDMARKLERWTKDPARNPFVDAGACRAYAATARKRLETRLATESKR